MSDQATAPQTAGSEPTLDSIYSKAVSFEQVAEDADWNEDGQPVQVDGDGQQTSDDGQDVQATEPAPQATEQKQQPSSGMTQEQILQLFAQQQQWNQQALPQVIAAAVQQTIQAMGLQQQAQAAPAAPADPYAGIDPNSPDAEWQRMQVDNQIMRQELAALKNKWQQTEQTWQQQQQQAQEQAQQQQFTGWVNENVSKATDFFFSGWNDSPQTQALKQMAATQIDAEWARRGYTQAGFTQAVQAVRPHIESIKQFKPAPQTAPNRAPGAGQRPGQAPSPAAQQQRTWSNPNEFWENGPMSQAAIMNRIRGQQ